MPEFVDFSLMETDKLTEILDNLIHTVQLSIDDFVVNGKRGMGTNAFWLIYPTVKEITLILMARGVNILVNYPLLIELSKIESA